MSCILKADYNNTLQLKCKLKCSKKNPATHQKQLKKEQKAKMQVCKVRAIVQDFIGIDFVLLNPAFPKTFYFKHNPGAYLIMIFVGNSDCHNIDDTSLVDFHQS